ncbi:MAG TPA: hypothetical protein VGO26_10680 [Amnibacterium sp.]|nr:hypothetical protein [Amnibacterium sp.]
MQIPKATIVRFLRDRGKDSLAEQADRHLPDQVDPAQYSEQLQRYGVDVPALIGKLPGPFKGLFGR